MGSQASTCFEQPACLGVAVGEDGVASKITY